MPNFVQTQQYESSSQSDDMMDQQNLQETGRVKQAQIAIKQESQWSRYFTKKVQEGIKVHYRCNNVKFRDTQYLQFGIWKVTLPNNAFEWKKGCCNCSNSLKDHICKHVIDMPIKLKHCKPYSIAKDVPLGKKGKRGRPQKATQALLID